jgi:molybdopterin-guanine dinucleotide biosynthesis protein A
MGFFEARRGTRRTRRKLPRGNAVELASQNLAALTFTAVLFVGGESRRMGADKATLIINGEPLWARQMKLLRELRPEKILVSARARPQWCPEDIEVVRDEPPSRGPLSGLAAALKAARTTHVLVLAVDLPRMTPAHLRELQSLARVGCGVIPVNDDGLEPLCAIYPVADAVIGAVATALTSGDVSLRGVAGALLRQARLDEIRPDPRSRGFYANMNTRDDFLDAAS